MSPIERCDEYDGCVRAKGHLPPHVDQWWRTVPEPATQTCQAWTGCSLPNGHTGDHEIRYSWPSVADIAEVHGGGTVHLPDGTTWPPQVYGPVLTNYRNAWGGALYYGPGTETALKLMPPGHFCPDVCDLDDFGEADTMRGHVIRAFFRVMHYWPKPGARALWRRPFGPR